MKKYLFFRTDRIGDFLVSVLLINSIKKNDPSAHFTIICSNKNYKYIKDFKFINKVILYPEINFFKKIKFFSEMLFANYYCSIVFDSKNRSIFSSIITKSKKKILITNKKIHKTTLKFLFDKIYIDKNYSSKIDILKDTAKYLNIKFRNLNVNAFSYRKLKNPFRKKIQPIINKKFVLFNFDEKWIHRKYIHNFTNIQPTYEDLINFFDRIVKKSKKNLIITNGYSNTYLTNIIKKKFKYFDKGIYLKKYNNKKIILFDKINFFSLEYLILKSELIITCHGAASHVAASFKKKIIDIIEFKKINFYKKWTKHYKNHLFVKRIKFNIMKFVILKSIK
jgi:ADP-heptose:LPS heptosyltransferase